MVNSEAGHRAAEHIHFQVCRKQKWLCEHPASSTRHGYTKHTLITYPSLKQKRVPCILSGFILGTRGCLWSLDALRTRLQMRLLRDRKQARGGRGKVGLCHPEQLL